MNNDNHSAESSQFDFLSLLKKFFFSSTNPVVTAILITTDSTADSTAIDTTAELTLELTTEFTAELTTELTSATESTTTTTTESTTTTSTTSSSTSTTTSTTSTTSTTTSTTSTTTSTTSTTTSTTSTTTSTTSTTTSTTSTTITSTTTSTSTTSKTTTTTTTSSTTTTTSTAQEVLTVIVTVEVPYATKDSSEALGLALGLGIPLSLILAAFVAYACCQKPCKSLGRDLYCRFCKSKPPVDNPIESTEKFDDYKNESPNISDDFRDYRSEYIKQGGDDDQMNNQSILINDEHLLPQENSFACVSISDFELNPLNVTTTSFFAPPVVNSLPNDSVQYTNEINEYSSKQNSSATNKPKPKGSILVRAYSEQEKNKFPES